MSNSNVTRPTISELEAILKGKPGEVVITPAGEVRVESAGAMQCARCKRGIGGSFALVGKGAPYEREAMHELCAAMAECERADRAEALLAEKPPAPDLVGELVEALEECRDALDQRADAEYRDGIPCGNWAMSLLGTVDAALNRAREVGR